MQLLVNGENAADRNQTVDIRRSVQRIETDNVFPLFVCVNLNRMLILFRDQHAGRVRGLQHVDEQLVGENIQFFHIFSLNINLASNSVSAKEIAEFACSPPMRMNLQFRNTSLSDGRTDCLDGRLDAIQ